MSRVASKKYNAAPSNRARAPLGTEVSTVNSYLYLTRPYPYNPDEVIGKKGIKKYQEMMRDEQIKAAMMAKQYAVIAPGWEIQPARHNKDADKKAAQEIADFIKQVFDDMEGSFDTKLIEMLSALVFGFSCAEKIFSLIDYSKFQGKIGLKDLKFRNPEGFDFHTDPFGNLYPEGVLSATPSSSREIRDLLVSKKVEQLLR